MLVVVRSVVVIVDCFSEDVEINWGIDGFEWNVVINWGLDCVGFENEVVVVVEVWGDVLVGVGCIEIDFLRIFCGVVRSFGILVVGVDSFKWEGFVEFVFIVSVDVDFVGFVIGDWVVGLEVDVSVIYGNFDWGLEGVICCFNVVENVFWSVSEVGCNGVWGFYILCV